MKRLLPALTIGVLASALALTLHLSGAALRLELPLSDWIAGGREATRSVSDKLQFPLAFLVAAAVAWTFLQTKRRGLLALVVGALVLELLAVAWVCGLYGTSFQPLPAMSAALLALGLAAAFVSLRQSWRNRPVREVMPAPETTGEIADTPRVRPPFFAKESPRPPALSRPAAAFANASAHEVTAIVCDIGNKHDLLEEMAPGDFVALNQRFTARAMEVFTAAGAYVDAGSGEGVIAIFGYPNADPAHAEKATREAMRFVEAFPGADEAETVAWELHAGVSSGKVVVAAPRAGAGTLAIGEPVELARRFCIANRFYGSRVLIGPQTFELSRETLVARPIDFLNGVDARERHEIYEPLFASTDVPSDEIMRRDSFWNGVVLYREKRWAESYAHFQRARGPNEEQDAPLQLYLRRLEPLALQLTDTPFDE